MLNIPKVKETHYSLKEIKKNNFKIGDSSMHVFIQLINIANSKYTLIVHRHHIRDLEFQHDYISSSVSPHQNKSQNAMSRHT